MSPELIQSCVLLAYGLLFFCLALFLWRKKHRRLNALKNHSPCTTYLRARLEADKLLDSKAFPSSSQSIFEELTLDMRGLIKDELECGFFSSVEESKKKRQNLENSIGSLFKTLEDKFPECADIRAKLRKAIVFEANSRLVGHPYDIIGIRRLKLFEESLKNFLEPKNNENNKMTIIDVVKGRFSQCFKMDKEGFHYHIFVVLKIVTGILLVTLIVNVNDYFQDFVVIRKFWSIGYTGHILEGKNSDLLSQLILQRFYPTAMFLSVVIMFSSVQTIFHLPSLWYRFKVSMQMESKRSELGLEMINPVHVVNQYNLPMAESKNESIWQMMTQWGFYFCFSWFVTWRLKLSDDDEEELKNVEVMLSFSTLSLSMMSSVVSLSYGQYVAHSICYKYRTSGGQKLIYLLSSAANTMNTTCILLSCYTAVMDFGIGENIYQDYTFGFFDRTIFIIAFLLITPFLYKFTVLPTSNSMFQSVSMNTPSFLHGMMMQCLVYALFLGLNAFLNSYTYYWGPPLVPSLPQIGFNITGNSSFLGIDRAEYTPANAYHANPINNRFIGIIISCVAIPMTWACSYLGLCFYFKDIQSVLKFYPKFKEDPETWKDKLRSLLRMSTCIKQVSNLVNEKPNLDGKWIDLNYTSNEPEPKNEEDLSKFLAEVCPEDKILLDHIRSSFPCWTAMRESKLSGLGVARICLNYAAAMIALYLASVGVGALFSHAKDISLWVVGE